MAPQSNVACLLTFKMGNEAMGASPSKVPFTELLGLSPSFNVHPEGVDLGLGCDNIVFKLSVAADFSKVGPVIQLPNSFSESVVMGGIPVSMWRNQLSQTKVLVCDGPIQSHLITRETSAGHVPLVSLLA